MNIQDTLNERGSRYGDFSVHARIAQALQDDMRCTEGWQRLNDSQRQALTVIADKIARILSGDPNYADNWHDIQGYARLVEERLPVQEVTGDGSGEALPPADGVMDTVLSCMSCGSHPSSHHPKCAEWKEPCLPSLDEVLGAAAPAQVSEALKHAGDGWIEWHGGECPVDLGFLVDVKFRDGISKFGIPALVNLDSSRDAGHAFWRNDGQENDIVAYRVSNHG